MKRTSKSFLFSIIFLTQIQDSDKTALVCIIVHALVHGLVETFMNEREKAEETRNKITK